ncbi:hypothetical protein FRB95_009710 [Tulasnella sp. JGI-2019a]|nr:hypothetical protein FRB95_009710 [Tulasnella sp. JGI-2019a]
MFEATLTNLAYNVAEGSEQSALVLGRAIVHIIIADPTRWAEPVARALDASGLDRILLLQPWDGLKDLWALYGAAYLARSATVSDRYWIEDRSGQDMAFLVNHIMDQAMNVLPSSQPSTTLALLTVMKLSR